MPIPDDMRVAAARLALSGAFADNFFVQELSGDGRIASVWFRGACIASVQFVAEGVEVTGFGVLQGNRLRRTRFNNMEVLILELLRVAERGAV